MLKILQTLFCYMLLLAVAFQIIEARPPNGENTQGLDNIGSDGDDEARNAYYAELPAQSQYYPSVPIDRLQMLIAQYRPTAYLRSPTWNLNELMRGPEMKRQVRYRQCYFNPISCFKK